MHIFQGSCNSTELSTHALSIYCEYITILSRLKGISKDYKTSYFMKKQCIVLQGLVVLDLILCFYTLLASYIVVLQRKVPMQYNTNRCSSHLQHQNWESMLLYTHLSYFHGKLSNTKIYLATRITLVCVFIRLLL